MQFYDFRTTRDLVAKGEPIDKFYDGSFSFALDAMQDKRTALQMLSEGMWERNRRPYYNVYVRRVTAQIDPPETGEGLSVIPLGHQTYLAGKPKGDSSMFVRRPRTVKSPSRSSVETRTVW